MPVKRYLPPLGGIKKNIPSHFVQLYQSPDANAVWPINGRLRKVKGISKYYNTALDGPVMLLDTFYKEDSSQIGIAITNRKTYKYESSAYVCIQDTTNVDDEIIATGDGIETSFNGTLAHIPLEPGSLSITDTVETFSDNGSGVLTGDLGGSGTINYTTGAWAVTFNSPPGNGQNILADYDYYNDFINTQDQPMEVAFFFDSSANEIMVITNYVDAMRKWDGASAEISNLNGSPPKAKCLTIYENFLFTGFLYENTDAHPRRVRWSAIGNGESWPASNYKDFKKTTDWIVALKTLGTRLVIYKERSISFMDYVGGALDFNVDENYISDIGPLNKHCIIDLGIKHLFISSDLNIYSFDGIDLEKISDNIDTVIKNLHPNYKARSSATYIEELNKVIWSVPYGPDEQCYLMIILDIKDNTWWLRNIGTAIGVTSWGYSSLTGDYTWDTHPQSSWDDWDDPDGWDSRELLANAPINLLGCNDGYVRRLEYGTTDDGTAIDSYYKYPWDNLDEDDKTLKAVTKVTLEIQNEGSGIIYFRTFTDLDEIHYATLDENGNTYMPVNLYGDETNQRYITQQLDVYIEGYSFMWMFGTLDTYNWTARVVDVQYEVIGEN